jgi:hypothetical protein
LLNLAKLDKSGSASLFDMSTFVVSIVFDWADYVRIEKIVRGIVEQTIAVIENIISIFKDVYGCNTYDHTYYIYMIVWVAYHKQRAYLI